MEERNIEAEYDAWVSRSVDLYERSQTRGQDLFSALMKIDPNGDWSAITRKYAVAQVLIYLMHGGDRDHALKYLEGSVK